MLHFSADVSRQRSWRSIFTSLEDKLGLWILDVAKPGVVRCFQIRDPAVGVETTLETASSQADAHNSIALVRIDIQSRPFFSCSLLGCGDSAGTVVGGPPALKPPALNEGAR